MTQLEHLALQEHSPSEHEFPAELARSLAASSTARLQVVPTGRNLWTITPGSNVGSVLVEDLRVTIRPKIGIRNVLYLMGMTLPDRVWQRDVLSYAHEPDLLSAMVQVFRRGLDQAIAQGLRHNYEPQEELLSAVRGRIDMTAAMRRPGVMTTLPCRFEEYTADFGLNRVLLAAARCSLRVPSVPIADRRRLHQHLEVLEDAGVSDAPVAIELVERWTPSYLDRHYEAAVRSGQLILQGSSISDHAGSNRAASFIVDMNKLVERFITEQLKTRLGADLSLSAQYPTHLDTKQRVPIRPDLVIRVGRRPVFVADIKYKKIDDVGEAATSDLYQLAAYARVLEVPCGALITVGNTQSLQKPDSIVMSPDGPVMHVWPVRLTGSREDIEHQLDALARKIEMEAGLPQAVP